MQARRSNSARDFDQKRKLHDALAEPDWQHEAARSGLSLVLRKGALILGLGLLCWLLFSNAPSPLIPVLIFLIGTTFIVLWDWSAPKSSD